LRGADAAKGHSEWHALTPQQRNVKGEPLRLDNCVGGTWDFREDAEKTGLAGL